MKIIFLVFLLGISSLISINYAYGDLSNFLKESEYTTYNSPYYSITLPSSLEATYEPNGSVTFEKENTMIIISMGKDEPIEDRDKFLDDQVQIYRENCESDTLEKDGQECSFTLLDSYKTILDKKNTLVVFAQWDIKGSLESDVEDHTTKCYTYAIPDDSKMWFVAGCIEITDHMATSPFMGFGESIALDILRDSLDTFTLENKYLMTFEELEYIKIKYADFIDSSKTPQYYLDRYNNEPEYKAWFDKNYDGITIQDAIGFPSYGTSQNILKEKGYLHKELLDDVSETDDSISELEQEKQEELDETTKVSQKSTIKKEIASFVEVEKDPQSYIDRYNNEPEYKAWFDKNYPDYTIHEAVGLPEPAKEKVPIWVKNNAAWWSEGNIEDDTFVSGIQYLMKEKIVDIPDLPEQVSEKARPSFVDDTKDPQSYVDRYNNEPEYKAWFDENYPDYTIEEAVGVTAPIPAWIKNAASWWSEGKISEDEFIKGIEYLVEKRILNVD